MFRKLLVLLLILGPGTLEAQRFGEAVEVAIVEVPVTVVDRSGNPIQGLTRENFEVYDDGRRAPIEYFEVVDLATVTAVPGRPVPPVAYRNFLLLFDLANSKPGTVARAQAAARTFLQGKLTNRDLVGAAVYTPNKGLRMLTSFSADRKLVMDAIDALGSSVEFRVADPLLLAGSGLLSAPLDSGAGARSGPVADQKAQGESEYAEERAAYDRATTAAQTSELTARVRSQLQNMGGIARALDGLHGQKQVILLSEGFDPRLIAGRQDISGQKAQEENAAIASGEIWKVDSDERYGSASGVREINDMASLFRRSDVRLHAIDIKGLRSEVDAREGVQKSSNEALFMITEPTGGSVFKNANDLGSNFDRLLKRQQYIYLLGITAKSSNKPGKFHTIKVKSTVRGAEVAHRAGYHEASERNSDLSRTLGLAEILVTDTPVNDVPLTVFASAAPGTGTAARVPVVVEISGPKLLQGLTGANATANIFVYAFDEQQQVRDFMQQRVVLDVAQTGDLLRQTGVRYVGALRLEPGTYAIKALVRIDETGRTGFLRTELEVPAYGERAVLQPLAMGDATKWVTLLSPSRGEDAAALLSVGSEPFVPSSPAVIAPGVPLRFALMVYRTQIADLGVTPVIVNPDGSTKEAAVTLVGRTQPDAVGVTKLVFEFKPDGLQQGAYELRLNVTPKDSPTSTVSLPFSIR
jgi:VWFA-related protein